MTLESPMMAFRPHAMVLAKVGRTKRSAVPAVQGESSWHHLFVVDCRPLLNVETEASSAIASTMRKTALRGKCLGFADGRTGVLLPWRGFIARGFRKLRSDDDGNPQLRKPSKRGVHS
mgnify:CR=1 FL=1